MKPRRRRDERPSGFGSELRHLAQGRGSALVRGIVRIRCGICVKTCSEIVNRNLLAAMKRGFNTQVGTAFNQGLQSYCTDCGACVEACPVGALDWKKKD